MRGERNVHYNATPAFRSNYERPKKQRHTRRLLKPVIILILFALTLWGIFFSPLFRINSIRVQGNRQTTTRDLQRDARQIMEGSLFGDNSLLINAGKVGERIQSRNQQLSSIVVTKGLFNSILITVVEQRPVLQWKSSSSVFVLSTNGEAYKEQSDIDRSLPVVEDSTNLPVKIGQKVAPAGFIEFTMKLTELLKQMKIDIKSLVVPETTNELYITTNKGLIIKFDTTRDAQGQLDDYRAAQVVKAVPKEYIDLRIAGKVFYK